MDTWISGWLNKQMNKWMMGRWVDERGELVDW